MKLLSTLCWVAGHVFKKKGRSKNFRAILTIPSHLHGTNNSQNIPNTQLYYTFLKFNINCQPLPRIGGFFHDHQSSRNRLHHGKYRKRRRTLASSAQNARPGTTRVFGGTMEVDGCCLVGGFKYFLFSSLPGEMIQFDEHIFQRGWNHQLLVFRCVFLEAKKNGRS